MNNAPLSVLENESVPRPHPAGTAFLVVCLLMTGLNLHGELPSQMARFAAIGCGIGILGSAIADARFGGLRGLVRTDLFSILALYFLSLFEFLFPQPEFDRMIGIEATRHAILGILWGTTGLAIGRHLAHLRHHPFSEVFLRPIPAIWLVLVFWASFAIGFLHMFMAVDFSPRDVVLWMMAPRFTQPWSRGRFGDFKALLNELALFLYLLPPIAGIMFARRHRYSTITLITCGAGLLFVLFYGFTSGSRNLVASYLVTLLIAYGFACPPQRRKEFLVVAAVCAGLLIASTVSMLRFREFGLWNYMSGNYREYHDPERSLFVDMNLYSIARLTEAFPENFPYLKMQIPYLALVRPIPRAVWPGKPEGLSLTIEQVLGTEQMTVAATFVGEAYMSGGYLAVVFCGLVLGAAAGWWNHLASPKNSDLGILIYASGFFAAVMTMRSVFVLTTALLPTLASLVIGGFLVRHLRSRPPPAPPNRRPPHRPPGGGAGRRMFN